MQKTSFVFMGLLFWSSLSFSLECPAVEEFKATMQLPPISFNPQTNQVHAYGLAGTEDLSHETSKNKSKWLMVIDTKIPLEQLSSHNLLDLTSQMSLKTEKVQKLNLNKEINVQYCLYQSKINPRQGAIAYYLGKGNEMSQQSQVKNLMSLLSLQ